MDRASGLISEEQFAELNQGFLAEKDRLEGRLEQADRELARWEPPSGQAALMERARELLRLDSIPRELVAALIERIEIGERDPETGRQEVRITWRF